jgi:DeoR/GlpR family transcriptional regulator of sugar metabolism
MNNRDKINTIFKTPAASEYPISWQMQMIYERGGISVYPTERREALLVLLARNGGFVSIQDLAKELSVSEITIRRDLKILQDKGLVEKVVGGGQVAGSASEPTFLNKRILQSAEKDAIAHAALHLIESNMTIGISAGTTTWTLARQIRGFTGLTFVTNSTNVAIELKANGYDDILLTGGQFRTPSDALVGPLAESAARSLHTDILFLGVHGIDLAYGISTPNIMEASINRIMMERTKRVVLLLDHTKWGLQALAHIADIDEIDTIITDEYVRREEIAVAREMGVEVLIALSVPTISTNNV